MTLPTGDNIPLKFPLYYNSDIESDTPNDPITYLTLSDWATSDPDEVVDIVIRLSLNEYVALANCIDVGRDIAYGENSIYLWWLWTRILQSMSICDSIIACINDPDSGVADSIINLISADSIDSARSVSQAQNNTSLADGYNPTCDLDILFGQSMQLVDYFHQVNKDVLEIIEVLTNVLDMFADVIGDISGVDESSIDAGISWIAFIQDNILENYLAQVTVGYLESAACDIFCAAQNNNCEITPDVLFTVFADRLDASLTIDGLILDTFLFLTSGTWTGTQIADFMFFSQMALRSQIGRILDNVAYYDINARLQIYSNDPNPDWSVICDSCVFEICFDMTDFTDLEIILGEVDNAFGDPAPSVEGVDGNINQYPINVTNSVNTSAVVFKYVFDHDVTIVDVVCGVYCDMTGWSSNQNGEIGWVVALRNVSETEIYRQGDNTPIGYQQWVDRSVAPATSGVREVWVWSAITTSDPVVAGNVWHDNLCIRYTDD